MEMHVLSEHPDGSVKSAFVQTDATVEAGAAHVGWLPAPNLARSYWAEQYDTFRSRARAVMRALTGRDDGTRG